MHLPQASFTPESCPFLQSFAKLGLPVFALDFLRLEFSTLLRSLGHFGLSIFVLKFTALGFSSLALDRINSDLSSFPHSCARFDSTISALDFLHLESLLLPHGSGCLDLAMLVFGLCKMEPSLSSLENMLLGFLLFLHSFAHLSFAVSVLDFLHLGFSLSVRQLGRMGFPFLTFGRCQAASSSSAVDLSPSDFSLSLQSSSQLDPVLLVFDLLHPDFMFLLHQLACFELASSTSDKFQVDSPSPASDFTLLGSLALFRNPGCPGIIASAFWQSTAWIFDTFVRLRDFGLCHFIAQLLLHRFSVVTSGSGTFRIAHVSEISHPPGFLPRQPWISCI